MSDDLLERVTRAARDEHAPSPGTSDREGDLGRRRLEGALVSEKRRHTRSFALTLVAASLAAMTAWAGVTGRLPRFLRNHDSEPVPTAAPPSTTTPTRRVMPAPSARAPASIETAPSADDKTIGPVPTAIPSPLTLPKRSELAPSTTTISSRPTSPPSKQPQPQPQPDIDALYQQANDAHFVQKDPAAALAAWDRYLTAAGTAGSARMTLEARYNRAITLVKLGRNAEAREALAPFAHGEYGAYRSEDAQRLLDSLR